jgi:hypothetical protein
MLRPSITGLLDLQFPEDRQFPEMSFGCAKTGVRRFASWPDKNNKSPASFY